MKYRILHRLFCMLLAVALVFSFSACRQSPVLYQIQYTDQAEADPDQQQRNNDVSHTLPDQEIAARTTNTTATRREDQTRANARKDDTPNTASQSAPHENYDAHGQDRDQAAEGTQDTPNNTAEQPNNGTDNNTQNQGAAEVPQNSPDPNAGAGTAGEEGAKYKLPENVDKVAAVGDSALYVEMLGGRSRLAASSESLFGSTLFNSLISDAGSIRHLWTGEGYDPPADFVAQLEALGVGAVFMPGENNYAMFGGAEIERAVPEGGTEEQIYLKNSNVNGNKILIIPLLPFNTTANIETNVSVMGRVLGYRLEADGSRNDGGAVSKANDYNNWLDSIVGEVSGRGHTFSGSGKLNFNQNALYNGATDSSYSDAGQYTLLINDWNTNVSYSVRGMSGVGMATVRSATTRTESPASYFLSLGGGANNASLVADDGKPRTRAVSPYTSDLYISGLSDTDYTAGAIQDKNRSMTWNIGGSIDGNPFNTILASSAAAKNNIENDQLWQRYGTDSNRVGDITVVINPYGIGDWKKGSPESPLEAIFASMVFSGDYSPDELNQRIMEFYSNYYDITLDGASLSNILDGEDSIQN